MAITVKHKFVSAIPDAGDPTIVQPSNWNDDHQLTGTIPVDNGGTGASTLTGYVKGNGTSAMTAASTIPSTDVTGLGTMSTQNANNVTITGGSISGTTVSGYIPTTEKGVANGVATLDGSGTVPISQLPSAVLGALSYQGTWNASTNTPTLTSSVGTKGYYYVVNVAGSTNLNGVTDWQVGDWAVYNGSAWQKVDNTDAVTSVNGYTGTVNLTYTDVGAFPATSTTGLGNVVLATGATQAHPTISDYETFTPTSAPSYAEGEIWYDSTQKALTYYNDVTNNQVHIGQEVQLKVINNTGSSIANGTPVYVTGTSSGQTYPNIALAQANAASTSAVLGLTNGAIASGAVGYVCTAGLLTPCNTGSFSVGQVLYLSPYSAGQLMNTVPPTGYAVQVGVVAYANTPNGSIYVKQTTPLAVSASTIIGQVAVANGGTGQSSYTDGQLLIGNSTGNTLTKSTLTAGTGVSIANGSGAITVTNSAPDQTVVLNNGTGISVTGTYPNFTVTNTSPSSGGTVTSITAGTGLSGGTITSSGTIALANTTVSAGSYTNSSITVDAQGRLTSASSGAAPVTSVTATSPVASTGGTTPVISMPAATGSVNGYLTSTDWTTFNNKGSGSVTSVSVTSANGFAGTVATATTTPAITISTSITGVLKGNGTAISAATAGTDYSAGTSANASGLVYNTTSTGALTTATGAQVSTALGTTAISGNAANVTGIVAGANGGTGVANTGSTITLGGSLTYSGAYTQTWTRTANTSLTLPVSGTVLSSTTAPTNNPITGTPSSSNYLRGDGTWSSVAVAPAGSDTQIQYNNAGSLGASSSLTFVSSTGALTAPEVVASNGIVVNNRTIGTSYSIPAGYSATSAGPITISTGVTVTVPTGGKWVVL